MADMAASDRPVLLCGATGFVGSALTARLVSEGATLRALVRPESTGRARLSPNVREVTGDLRRGTGLDEALADVREVFYLVHSMGRSVRGGDFDEADRQAARHLVEAASRSGAERIIYVGGLGDDASASSSHLKSRREVGKILRSGGPSVTELRAGIILGAGGSSFEMMVQLVERLPGMLCPIWIDRRCQPIALDDLVAYLVGCWREDGTRGATFDVGGPDVLRYSEMLLRIGRQLGRPPCLVVLPRFTPSLSSHWVGYITDVPAELARPIIDGMYVDAVCHEQRIRDMVAVPLTGFEAALDGALRDRRAARGPARFRGGHLLRPLEGRVFRLYRSTASGLSGPGSAPGS